MEKERRKAEGEWADKKKKLSPVMILHGSVISLLFLCRSLWQTLDVCCYVYLHTQVYSAVKCQVNCPPYPWIAAASKSVTSG